MPTTMPAHHIAMVSTSQGKIGEWENARYSSTGRGLNKDADGGHKEGEAEDGLVHLPETHDVVMVHHTNCHLWE
jgi:hypothetical protein